MKRIKILLVLGMFIGSLNLAAQTTARDKIEAAKIGMITERLNLTSEQAEKFWPIYKEFNQKRSTIRKEFRRTKRSLEGTSEDNDRLLIEKRLESKEKQLNLEKEYSSKMARVISSGQINSLRKAEEDFRKMLLRRVEQRQLQRDNQNNLRQQRQRNIVDQERREQIREQRQQRQQQ